MTTPDLTRKVLGYRRFALVKGELLSTGVGFNVAWQPGENRARCFAHHWSQISGGTVFGVYPPAKLPNFHDAPRPGCGCGLYAFYDVPAAWAHGELVPHDDASAQLAAAVLAWGHLEAHRNGFRAECAEVVLIAYDPFVGPRALRHVHRAAKEYGIRAVPISDLEREGRQFGRTVPPSLLPEPEKPQLPPARHAAVSSSGSASLMAWHPAPSIALASVNNLSSVESLDQPEPDRPSRRRRLPLWPIVVNLASVAGNSAFGLADGHWWSWVGAGVSGAVAAVLVAVRVRDRR